MIKKLIKGSFLIIFIIASMCLACACGQKQHTHLFSTIYSYDENSHWYKCNCGEEKDKAMHLFVDGLCECGYKKEVVDVKNKFTDGLVFTLSEKGSEYVINDYEGSSVDIVIPKLYKNKPVFVGENLFKNDTKIETLVLNAVSVGDFAFQNCDNLKAVVISNDVETLGEKVLCECKNIVYNEENNLQYLGNGENPFMYLVKTKERTTEKVVVNKNCRFIASYAFAYTDIAEIDIPISVESIGSWAFVGCKKLQEIEIPDSISKINVGTFSWCENLKYVDLSNKLVNIGELAFNSCNSIKEINIPNSVKYVDSHAFYNCISLAEVKLGKGVIELSDFSFCNCRALIEIEIPKNVEKIGTNAFDECLSLKQITVDENNNEYKSINGNLYSKDGKKLIKYAMGKVETSFSIPNIVEIIEINAFQNSTKLTCVVIPMRVKQIGHSAFFLCENLKKVIFENTQGWRSGNNVLSSNDLKNEELAATYLVDNYIYMDWIRE